MLQCVMQIDGFDILQENDLVGRHSSKLLKKGLEIVQLEPTYSH